MTNTITSTIQKRIAMMLLVTAMLFGMMGVSGVYAQTTADTESMTTAQLQAQVTDLLTIIAQLQAKLSQSQSQDKITDGAMIQTNGLADQNIKVGSQVKTAAMLRVRAGAGTGAKWLSNVPESMTGRVVDGPQVANGYTWWNINYDNGMTGWSAENWLYQMSKNSTGGLATADEIDAANENAETKNFSVSLNGTNKASATLVDVTLSEAKNACMVHITNAPTSKVECFWGDTLIRTATVSTGTFTIVVGDEERDNLETADLTESQAIRLCNSHRNRSANASVECYWKGTLIDLNVATDAADTAQDSGTTDTNNDSGTASTDAVTKAFVVKIDGVVNSNLTLDAITLTQAKNSCAIHIQNAPTSKVGCFWGNELIRYSTEKTGAFTISIGGDNRDNLAMSSLTEGQALRLCNSHVSRANGTSVSCYWDNNLIYSNGEVLGASVSASPAGLKAALTTLKTTLERY